MAAIGRQAILAAILTIVLASGATASGLVPIGRGGLTATPTCGQNDYLVDSAGATGPMTVQLPSGCAIGFDLRFVVQSGHAITILPERGGHILWRGVYAPSVILSGEGVSTVLQANGSNYVPLASLANPSAAPAIGPGARVAGLSGITSGQPYFDVRASYTDGGGVEHRGAVGDQVSDDHDAIQHYIDIASPLNGLIVFPPGNYCVWSGLTINGPGFAKLWALAGAELQVCGHQVSPLTVDAAFAAVRGLFIAGPGFGAGGVVPRDDALTVGPKCVSCTFTDLYITGGRHALSNAAPDDVFTNVTAQDAYGSAVAYVTSSGYFIRDKFDQVWIVVIPTPGGVAAHAGASFVPQFEPRPWRSGAAYNVGDVTSLNGFYIQAACPFTGRNAGVAYSLNGCLTGAVKAVAAGTSGSSPPTLANYETRFSDGTVSWYLLAPTLYYGQQFDTGTSVPYAWGGDYSGPYTAGIALTNTRGVVNGGPQGVEIYAPDIGQTISAGILAHDGNDLKIIGGNLGFCVGADCVGGLWTKGNWGGEASMADTIMFQNPFGIVLQKGANTIIHNVQIYGANRQAISVRGVSDFVITGSMLGRSAGWGPNACAVSVIGASDHYIISDNIVAGAGRCGSAGSVSIENAMGANRTVRDNQ